MVRGRKVDVVPEFAEISPARRGEYRCTLCQLYHREQSESNGWIEKKSWKKHITSQSHKRYLEQRERVMKLAAVRQALEEEEPVFLDNSDDSEMPAGMKEPPQSVKTPHARAAESQMWRDLDSGNYKIAMDDSRKQRTEQLQDFERQVKEYNLLAGIRDHPPEAPDTELDSLLHDGEGEDKVLAELLERAGISEKDALSKLFRESGLKVDEDWAPYPSKLVFLLDAIDNIPRLRISAELMKIILWLLEEAGLKDVPTLSHLRDWQASLRKEKGVETIDWMSPLGNAYSFNNPVDIIAKDWSNPKVRPHIRRYPVLPKDGMVSEIWHGDKWRKTLDRHALSPMYDDGQGRHYYIDELAKALDDELVVPVRWLEDAEGTVWFEGWRVTRDNDNRATILDSDDVLVLLRASVLKENFMDLFDQQHIPSWSERTIAAGHPARMPNPDRELAQGDPIYTSFIDVFGDDVSGNRSKSWNKHWNIYIKHRNLPRSVLQKDVHTRFISTSPNASIPEQFQGIKQIIEETHQKPAKIYDCHTGQHIRLKLQCNCEPGDNPAQSEAAGHIGPAGNFPCRKCTTGGTKDERRANGLFHQLFEPGAPRTVQDTLTAVRKQVKTACRGVATHVEVLQRDSGVKDAYTQHWIDRLIEWSRERQSNGKSLEDVESELAAFVEEHGYAIYNAFLTMRYSDINQDTPIEILHTILLGIVKYSWHWTHSSWKDAQKAIYTPRLQGTNVKGLSIPAIRAGYITQYANSLIGRQLKVLVQTNAFHVHDLVSEDQYRLIKATGELSALLWFPEISNMEEYLQDIEIAIANVLDCAAVVDPSKIIAKIKYHLLTHIPQDVKNFGPIIGVSTESYESFNIIFRHCSILSNHQAPSRDIAHQLAKQETFKHFVCSGWWDEGGEVRVWKQTGTALQKYVSKSKVLQHIYDFSSPEENAPTPGHAVLAAMQRASPKERPQPRTSYVLADSAAQDAIIVDPARMQSLRRWHKCKSVIVNSGDECREGSWVFARGLETVIGEIRQRAVLTGRILEILKATDEDYTIVVIKRFEIAQDLHPRYGMPILRLPFGETSTIAVAATDVLFDFNVQHDCCTIGCSATGKKAMKQERVNSERFEQVVEHADIERFVINTHAFHNAHLLRSVTTALRDLLRPKLLYPARRQHHYNAASALRESKAVPEKDTESGIQEGQTGETAGPSKKRKRPAGTPIIVNGAAQSKTVGSNQTFLQ